MEYIPLWRTSNAPTLNSQVYLMFNAVLCNFAEETNIFITGWFGAPDNWFIHAYKATNKPAVSEPHPVPGVERPVNKKYNHADFSWGNFCRIILTASLSVNPLKTGKYFNVLIRWSTRKIRDVDCGKNTWQRKEGPYEILTKYGCYFWEVSSYLGSLSYILFSYWGKEYRSLKRLLRYLEAR